MDTLSYKTIHANKETVKKNWLLVDAENEVIGRLASKVAYILRGKNKPDFTPHADCGDNVIVINAGKVRFTGKKLTDKVYIRHTRFPGGQRFSTPKEWFGKKPEFMIERAVKKMLPTNRLSDKIIRNLFVYAGSEHPHAAQNPRAVKLEQIKEHNS